MSDNYREYSRVCKLLKCLPTVSGEMSCYNSNVNYYTFMDNLKLFVEEAMHLLDPIRVGLGLLSSSDVFTLLLQANVFALRECDIFKLTRMSYYTTTPSSCLKLDVVGHIDSKSTFEFIIGSHILECSKWLLDHCCNRVLLECKTIKRCLDYPTLDSQKYDSYWCTDIHIDRKTLRLQDLLRILDENHYKSSHIKFKGMNSFDGVIIVSLGIV